MGGCRHAISLRVFDPIAYEWVIEFNTRRKISISMLPTREVVFINEWKKIGDARLKMKNALNHYSTRNNGHNFQFTKLSVLDFFPSTEAIVSGTRPKSAFLQTRLPEVDFLGNVSAAYWWCQMHVKNNRIFFTCVVTALTAVYMINGSHVTVNAP